MGAQMTSSRGPTTGMAADDMPTKSSNTHLASFLYLLSMRDSFVVKRTVATGLTVFAAKGLFSRGGGRNVQWGIYSLAKFLVHRVDAEPVVPDQLQAIEHALRGFFLFYLLAHEPLEYVFGREVVLAARQAHQLVNQRRDYSFMLQCVLERVQGRFPRGVHPLDGHELHLVSLRDQVIHQFLRVVLLFVKLNLEPVGKAGEPFVREMGRHG